MYMNGIGIILLVLVGLTIVGFNIWLVVITIQFMRVLTQAAHRYLAVTASPFAGQGRGQAPDTSPAPAPVAPDPDIHPGWYGAKERQQ
jgi:hypothetical protein